jgi:hypothetical protein
MDNLLIDQHNARIAGLKTRRYSFAGHPRV